MPEEAWSQTSTGSLSPEACTKDHQVPAAIKGNTKQ